MTLSRVAGAHYVEAWIDDRQIEGSPFLVEVFDTSSVLVAPPERATVGKTLNFEGNHWTSGILKALYTIR